MKAMNKIMLSCKKATELVERKHENKLTLKEGFQLSLHLLMCKTCSVYEKQSKLLNKALNQFFKNKGESEKELIKNEQLKEKIISKL